MIHKKGAAQKSHPDNKVKQVKDTKTIINLISKLSKSNGKHFEVPPNLKELFILKLAAFELGLEVLLSDYLKTTGGIQWQM